MELAAGKERNESGVDVGRVVATNEQPVFSADGLSAELSFADVVVNGQTTIVEEAGQRLPLVCDVSDGGVDRCVPRRVRPVGCTVEKAGEYRFGLWRVWFAACAS